MSMIACMVLRVQTADSALIARVKYAAGLCGQTMSQWAAKTLEDAANVVIRGAGSVEVGFSAPHQPAKMKRVPIVERAVEETVRRGHDPKTCRIYGCLVCKEMDA